MCSLYLGDQIISGVATPVEGARNIGQIVQSTLPLNDAGLHLLDGALINGSGIYSGAVSYIAGLVTDYPDLFTDETTWQNSVTTYGVCGKFVYDSTANTVRLPKITGFVEGTTDLNALGELIEAGLPNIQGDPTYGDDNSEGVKIKAWNPTGCFVAKATSNTMNSSGVAGAGNTATFDASQSNPIYGNSSTVQPQSIKVLYYIVVATSVKTDIEVDIDQVTTDLNGKADVDLSNATPGISFANVMNTVGIRTVVETYINGTSWYRVYSDGWCEQGGITSCSNTGTMKQTTTLLIPYINTTYSVFTQGLNAQNVSDNVYISTRLTNEFETYTTNISPAGSYTNNYLWLACGYIR